MAVDFERGDPNAPKGHALLYFRSSVNPDEIVGTYVICFPISFDVSKYVPPFLMGQVSGLDESMMAFSPSAGTPPLQFAALYQSLLTAPVQSVADKLLVRTTTKTTESKHLHLPSIALSFPITVLLAVPAATHQPHNHFNLSSPDTY